MKINEDLVT